MLNGYIKKVEFIAGEANVKSGLYLKHSKRLLNLCYCELKSNQNVSSELNNGYNHGSEARYSKWNTQM